MARAKRTTDRPFPWRCGTCDQKEVYRTPTPYKTTIKYEGRPYDVEIPDLELPKCCNCGEVVFDNHAGHQIDRAFRQQLGLLQPEAIRAGRTELALSQKEFAARLGVAEESVSRWETGALIQSRVVDRQIRLFFELPSVRNALSQLAQGEPIGEAVKSSAAAEAALGGGLFHGRASAELEAIFQARIDTVVTAWLAAAEEVSGHAPATRLAPKSCDIPDVLTLYRSYCSAATRYAVVAPREEVACIAQVLSSLRERSAHGDRRRWFAAFVGPNPKTAAPVSKRLAKITEELERLPETDAPALLDHFRRLLQLWTRRQPPTRERLERTIREE